MAQKVLFLFDVDGTLTKPRLKISEDMTSLLKEIHGLENYDLGFVGGSDLSKQEEQLGKENMDLFTWKFAENGLMAYHEDELINLTSLISEIGEENYQELINACLLVLSEVKIPVKRGNFIEMRNGMINVSPIGRSCSQVEREQFEKLDKICEIRKKMIDQIKARVPHLNLTYSIGGQISMDIFPRGWDKTYCLQFLKEKYDQIYFFGDKTEKGGNDHEIYIDPRVKAFSVRSYEDTMEILRGLL